MEEINHAVKTQVRKVQQELVETKMEVQRKLEATKDVGHITVGRIFEERKLPTYNANNKGTQSHKFLEGLERHFKIRATPEDRKLDFAIDQLEGDVAIWANTKKSQWLTFADLKRDLLKTYWSDSVQKRLLAELLRPRMYNARLGTMTHHVWYWVKKTHYMDPPIGQSLFIEALIKHFPFEVENILLGSKIETVEELINLLERIEDRDHRPNRSDDRHHSSKNVHHINGRRGQGHDRSHGRGGRYRNRGPKRGNAEVRAPNLLHLRTQERTDQPDLPYKPDRDTQLAERREYVQQLSLMMKTIYCMKHQEEIGDSSQQALVIPKIEIGIDNWGYEALIDTGSTISVVSEEMIKQLKEKGVEIPELPVTNLTVQGATGKIVKVQRQVMPIGEQEIPTLFVVRGLVTPIILGTDWLKKYAAEIDFRGDKLKFQYKDDTFNLPLAKHNEEPDDETIRPQFAIEMAQGNDTIVSRNGLRDAEFLLAVLNDDGWLEYVIKKI
ncbi:hypothetical protein QE152_g30200 [Popillia japonica]|uniref:Peptidase A2 domain-containing protein n=1 Tax=Popillia japonica TaxID=7064 RepID=A0AAW1JF22_POPJA